MTRVYLVMSARPSVPLGFLVKTTATPRIYTLSLHDALPISCRSADRRRCRRRPAPGRSPARAVRPAGSAVRASTGSEEHTSELQSLAYLVCRLLLEKNTNSPGPLRLIHLYRRTQHHPTPSHF